MYHSLSDGQHPDSQYPKYATRLSVFRDHLKALLGAGFRLLSLRALLDERATNTRVAPKTCILTFDDGHRSALEFAGAMEDAGVRGTFFLTSDYCRKRTDFLQPNEITDLASRGFDFGTHGASHKPLSSLGRDDLETELADSKSWLEEILRHEVSTMSLPAGQGGRAVRAAAFRYGYRIIGNSRETANSDLYTPGEINRFVILAGHGPADVLKLASASPAYVWRRRLRAAMIWLPKKILRRQHRTREIA